MAPRWKVLVWLAFAAALLPSCGPSSTRGDLPPNSGYAQYARYFDRVDGGVVSISPYDGSADTLWLAGESPSRIVCMSTSHVGFLDAIGADSLIVAVSGCGFVSSPRVRARIDSGDVREAGYDSAPALETLVELKPDLVLCYAVGAGEEAFSERLRALGLRTFTLYEHLEAHPLARAEYLRLFGILTGREDAANSLFAEIVGRYEALAGDSFAALGMTDAASDCHPEEATPTKGSVAGRQKVLLNLPYAGQWYIPGAESYLSRLIRDAGGEVLGAEAGETRSSVISLEKAYQLSLEADFWLNAGSVRSLDELLGLNAAFSAFPVARPGRVFTNDRLSTPAGGNDFWESGAVRPDLILQDLRRIFSGRTDSLYYYQPVL